MVMITRNIPNFSPFTSIFMKPLYLPVIMLGLMSCGLAFAQQNNTQSQIQTGTQPGSPAAGDLGNSSTIKNIPELYPGETSDFGPQRLVKEKQFRKWVELNLD